MRTIGTRLKDERERLGMTQPTFAEVAGAKKRTVIDWEKDVSSPTAAQVAALSDEGMDALYVLTGQRNSAMPSANAAEQALLDSFRKCNEQGKQSLIQTAALLAAGMGSAEAPGASGSRSKHVSSINGHAAGRDVHVNQGETNDSREGLKPKRARSRT